MSQGMDRWTYGWKDGWGAGDNICRTEGRGLKGEYYLECTIKILAIIKGSLLG